MHPFSLPSTELCDESWPYSKKKELSLSFHANMSLVRNLYFFMFYNVYWLHQAISELHKQERLQIQKKRRDTALIEEWMSHLNFYQDKSCKSLIYLTRRRQKKRMRRRRRGERRLSLILQLPCALWRTSTWDFSFLTALKSFFISQSHYKKNSRMAVQ